MTPLIPIMLVTSPYPLTSHLQDPHMNIPKTQVDIVSQAGESAHPGPQPWQVHQVQVWLFQSQWSGLPVGIRERKHGMTPRPGCLSLRTLAFPPCPEPGSHWKLGSEEMTFCGRQTSKLISQEASNKALETWTSRRKINRLLSFHLDD